MTLKVGRYSIKNTAIVIASSVIFMLFQNGFVKRVDAKSFWQGSTSSTYLFDDNYYKTNSDKVLEQTLTLTPSSTVSIEQQHSTLNFNYAGIYGVNKNISNENQLDHSVSSGFQIKFDDVSSFSFNAKYQSSRDKRGVSSSPITSNRPLAIWSGKTSSAIITTPFISKSKLRLAGEFQERVYQESYVSSSRNILKIDLTTILPVTFKTAFQIKYTRQTFAYHVSSASNSQINRLSAGASWKATGKITSFANFGLENNSRSQSGSIYSGFYTDIRFKWRRKSYSTIGFTLSRKTSDTGNIVDGYLVSNIMSFNWKHKFPRKWGASIGTGFKVDQFESERKDVFVNPNIGIQFTQSRNFQYISNLAISKRKSNKSALNYDNIVFSIGINLNVGNR